PPPRRARATTARRPDGGWIDRLVIHGHRLDLRARRRRAKRFGRSHPTSPRVTVRTTGPGGRPRSDLSVNPVCEGAVGGTAAGADGQRARDTGGVSGSVTTNTDPTPSSESTEIVPPMRWTSSREM